MSCYLKNGPAFYITSEQSMDIRKELPPGNYTVKFDSSRGSFFFLQVDDFQPMKKVYGKSNRHAERIINTFMDRPNSTGVILCGEKGSGKTMLAKNISIDLHKQGVPTILITEPWHDESFKELIQNINQPALVIFDEFEKVYDKEQQEAMLTLLDGVFPSKKLFILTCNNKWTIDYNMRNRPGRIFYLINFTGLDAAFIREYCEDNLNNKDNIDSVCKMSVMFEAFNFDILKAIVEEMNRYNESVHEAVDILNATPEFLNELQFEVSMFIKDKEVPLISPKKYRANPMRFEMAVQTYKSKKGGGHEYTGVYEFRHEHVTGIDMNEGTFNFTNDEGVKMVWKKPPVKEYDYRNMLQDF
jgi:hypothetical protein